MKSSGKLCASRNCFDIRSKIGQLAPDMQNDPLVKSVSNQLAGIEQIVAKPFGEPLSLAEVTKVSENVNRVIQEIQKKN